MTEGTNDLSPKQRNGAGDDYAIGYARPPEHAKFKRGQSGNPRGRPKGSRNESTMLRELLHRKINARDGGRSRKITILEGILLRITEDALKGDTKSAAFILNRYGALVSGETPQADIGHDDREILEAFARRLTTPRAKELQP
jgi:Family of unknown function (DUF5681)